MPSVTRGRLDKTVTPRGIWAIVLVALAIRIAFLVGYPQIGTACEDCHLYDNVGWNLASGRGFVGGHAAETFARTPTPLGPNAPELGMAPAYAGFVGLIYRLLGHDARPVFIAQAVLSAAMVWFVFTTVRHAFDEPVARIASLFVAVYPPLIIYTGVLLSESNFAFLLVVWVWAIVEAWRHRSPWRWAIAGIVGGFCALQRAEALAALPLFAVLLLIAGDRRRIAASCTAFVLSAILVVVPWTIRNYQQFHRVVVVSIGSEVLYLAARGWPQWQLDDPELVSLVRGRDYLGQNEVLGREAWRIITGDPIRFVRLCIRRIPVFWISSHTSYFSGFTQTYRTYWDARLYARVAVKVTLTLLNLLTVALGAWGAWLTCRRRQTRVAAAIVAIPIVVVAATHVIYYSSPRFSVPIMPFVLILASMAIARTEGNLGMIVASRVHPH